MKEYTFLFDNHDRRVIVAATFTKAISALSIDELADVRIVNRDENVTVVD